MTRVMYDGVSALAAGIAAIRPQMVAGYVNGAYAWDAGDWALFPHADHVTISVNASANVGDVLDVESGDATPGQVAEWIRMRKAAGVFRPTVYCSRDTIPAVRAGSGAYILGVDYDIWVGDWTGAAHQVIAPPPGAAVACAATQYESTPHWDVSEVYDDGWPHRTPPAPPAPAGPTKADALAALATLSRYVG